MIARTVMIRTSRPATQTATKKREKKYVDEQHTDTKGIRRFSLSQVIRIPFDVCEMFSNPSIFQISLQGSFKTVNDYKNV